LHNGKGDRVESIIVKDVDILLLEGWFIGFSLSKEIDENLLLPNNE
jgi:pantothenate kinase-related protein Tda10